jgi:L-lactate utilization protein LutB
MAVRDLRIRLLASRGLHQCGACLVLSRLSTNRWSRLWVVYPGPIGAVITPQLMGLEKTNNCLTRRVCAGLVAVCPVDRYSSTLATFTKRDY